MSKETVQSIHLIQKCMEINEKKGRLKITIKMTENNYLDILVKDITTGESYLFIRSPNGHESEKDTSRQVFYQHFCNILAELEKLEGK